ncbi:permeases of the major facilitator superfamily [Moorella thermoacetica Y72]|uniref:Permeases of the major facilitator superfamily n=1 Tax=Moorella thermoacetica Y72 TaxID=1325331 RepID=A0A0S6UFX9_NEOTH|nr:permeases of the major facilitator superfamily [Moorella thermoacetica Y72]
MLLKGEIVFSYFHLGAKITEILVETAPGRLHTATCPRTSNRTTASRSPAFFGPVQETDILGYHVRYRTFLAVGGFVGTRLQAAIYGHQATFAQVVGAGFGQLAPDGNPDEVSTPFPLLVDKITVYRQGKGSHGYTAGCITQLGVTGEAAD